MIRTLLAYPTSSSAPLFWQIESTTTFSVTTLDLVYRISGDMRQIEIPKEQAEPFRADNLWQATCCEVFLRRKNQPAPYLEFNFAPSGLWAFYRFSGYRKALERPDVNAPPIIKSQIETEALTLTANMPWSIINDHLPGTQPLEAGISVILKEKCGNMSYWAVKHSADKPDFHNPDSFFAL